MFNKPKINSFLLVFFLTLFCPIKIAAEYKSDIPSGQNIPKIEISPESPNLINGHVYPNWGPICQRYTYSVIYQDDKNRPPEYIKIYFNGQMFDMEKEDPKNNDYFRGIKYIYKYVPNKLGSNFYFFEASNGLGKARSNIIDSPDNGPVLFNSSFENNEIAVINIAKKAKILSYDVKDEWVGGIALSDDGKYLAAKTNKKIYFFDTSKPDKPLWTYEGPNENPGDVKGGIDISGNGSRIFASIAGRGILFDSKSNKPLWIYEGTNGAYNAAISKDGKYMAMGTAGGVSSTTAGYESSQNTNLLILWNEKNKTPLWQYHAEGNFHDVSLSDDGSFIAGATGCPDRRFYLFSRDSNKPLLRSEMLTYDSPIHRAKISADGQYVAVGSESSNGAVFLFNKNSSEPVWKYPMPQNSSARALNFTSDGYYIGAATFNGDVFIFSRNSSTPVSHWNVPASLGGIDIAEDGSFVVAGGTDNKIHIFKKGAAELFSTDFKEYVEEIDISADNKLIAVGTGGSVYFFEAFDENTPPVECKEIIEPSSEKHAKQINNQNNKTINNNNIDTAPDQKKWPGMISGFGFIFSLFSLFIYLISVKFGLISKIKFKHEKEPEKPTVNKIENVEKKPKYNLKIILPLGILTVIFLVLSLLSVIINKSGNNSPQNQNNNQIINDSDSETENNNSQKTDCGNGMCEPDYGETKGNCPIDCSEAD